MTRARRRRAAALLLWALAIGPAAACGGARGAATDDGGCAPEPPEQLRPRVHRVLAHDTGAFTQGLVVHDGRLYESTGLEGRSTLRELDPDSGEVVRSVPLAPDVFGEGLAVGAEGRLVQLTWTDGVAYEWDPARFEVVGSFRYDGEGWGLSTLDDGTLVMSDGSDTLALRDPATFEVLERIRVRRQDGPADQLNELEWDGALLWANRYTTDEVVGIDLDCGTVAVVVDVSELSRDAAGRASAADPEPDVSNGVAHLPGTDRYLLTGKLWPVTYEVTLARRGPNP